MNTNNDIVFAAESPIHGRGVFAAKPIPAGTRILEYTGEKISLDESLRRCEAGNEYIFQIDDRHAIDGSGAENIARLINHSCLPNCEALIEDGRVFIIALRDIAAGEELTFNYGYDLVDYREYRCQCGSPNCVGYIVAEEFFPILRRQREMTTA